MKKTVLGFMFFLSAFLLFSYQKNSYNDDINTLKSYQLKQLKSIYDGALATYRLNANIVFDNIIMQPDVLGILTKLPQADNTKIKFLHDKLYDTLKDRYLKIKDGLNIGQLHFHLKDGRSFLRMHKPDKYGDQLFGVRYSLKKSNMLNKYVEGFEEGRVFYGYRYVYQISHNGVSLGSVEISISMNVITKYLLAQYPNHGFYFMIDKNIVKSKSFSSETTNYDDSRFNNNFLVDRVSVRKDTFYTDVITELSNDYNFVKQLLKFSPLVECTSISGQNIISTFMPIKNVKGDSVAYLVSFNKEDTYVNSRNNLVYGFIYTVVLLLSLIVLFYILLKNTYYVRMEKQRLAKMVEDKTSDLVKVQEEQVKHYRNMILGLVNFIEERDKYTAGHTRRVAEYSLMIAKAMGFDGDDLKNIYEAAVLHDIGKVVTPDSVLLKPGKFTDNEYSIMKEHVLMSVSMLEKINLNPDIIDIVKYHHERYDGSGYPYGLPNEKLPMLSRILTVADSFDAMTTNRIYKAKKSIKDAIKELNSLSCISYDPCVLEIAKDVLLDVVLEDEIPQLPLNHVEQARFSHHFEDSLTGAYNLDYLRIVLEPKANTTVYMCANIIDLKDFSFINDKYGWKVGNDVLINTAKILSKTFNDALIFRIFGDDFAIISKEHLNINIEDLTNLINEKISYSVTIILKHYDMKNEKERSSLINKLNETIGKGRLFS